jgi:hypothetical protein
LRDFSPAFSFHQALVNHFRERDRILWTLIGIGMQHLREQGPQSFWEYS